eukprot:1017134-Alexandrium_andersonii.AAC.1
MSTWRSADVPFCRSADLLICCSDGLLMCGLLIPSSAYPILVASPRFPHRPGCSASCSSLRGHCSSPRVSGGAPVGTREEGSVSCAFPAVLCVASPRVFSPPGPP